MTEDEADEQGLYCDSCEFYPVETKEYRSPIAARGQGAPESFRFCEFCSHTHTGGAKMYPGSRSGEHTEVVRSMGWSHNRLMAEIRGKR
jgi:hypothetical protein